jgi:hypothetical protein
MGGAGPGKSQPCVMAQSFILYYVDQFQPLAASFDGDGLNEPDSSGIKFVVNRIGLQRSELLGLQAAFEGAERDIDRFVQSEDGRHILRDSGGELLRVGIADARMGFHDDARPRVIDAGLPGAFGADHVAVGIQFLCVLAKIPDIPGGILCKPVQCVLREQSVNIGPIPIEIDFPNFKGYDPNDDSERPEPGVVVRDVATITAKDSGAVVRFEYLTGQGFALPMYAAMYWDRKHPVLDKLMTTAEHEKYRNRNG